VGVSERGKEGVCVCERERESLGFGVCGLGFGIWVFGSMIQTCTVLLGISGNLKQGEKKGQRSRELRVVEFRVSDLV